MSFLLMESNAVSSKIIYLDPGHGGIDGGASVDGIEEDDINLEISLKLKSILSKSGYLVYLTRDGDYDLATDLNNRKRTDIRNRVELINKSECYLYLSIHLNIFSIEKYSGAQVFYSNINENSSLLANRIQNSLVSYLGNTNRLEVCDDSIYLINHISKVGCLVECGFLSNTTERNLLVTDEYQMKLAYAIAYGIDNYALEI